MKKIAIVNIMRFGDIIQSLPLIYSIKKEYPQSQIHLIIAKAFSSVCEVLPYVDKVHFLDFSFFYKLENNTARFTALVYDYLKNLVDSLRAEHFDLCINLTPTNSAVILGKLINAKKIEGTYFDPNGFRILSNSWMQYFYVSSLARHQNSINLVDMFIKGAGFPVQEYVPYLREKINPKKSGADGYLCVHLGASERKRSMLPETLGEAANIIFRETGLKVCLLGVGSEQDLAERFQEVFKGTCLNLVGKTSVKELAEVLGASPLLICHDTGPMHVAWAMGTRVLSVFLATANPFETGPYGTDDLVLDPTCACHPCEHSITCKTFDCKGSITPHTLAQVALYMLRGDPLPMDPKAVALRTTHDVDGMVELTPLVPIPFSIEKFGMLCWRSVIPPILDGCVDRARILHNLRVRVRRFFGTNIGNISQLLGQELSSLREILGMLELGVRTLGLLMEEARGNGNWWSRVAQLSGELRELEKLMLKWAYQHKQWEFPINMLVLGLKSFPAKAELRSVIRMSLDCYERAYEQFRVLYQILNDFKEEGKDGNIGEVRWKGAHNSSRDHYLGGYSGACAFQ